MGKGGPEGGRPRKELDLDTLRNMVRIQCTAEECAGVFECSVDTLDRRLKEEGYGGFADFYKRYGDEGKASLRRAQWKAAQDGNPTMLVWLGKQMLGQRDKQDFDHTSSDGTMSPKPGVSLTMTPEQAAEAYAASIDPET
jgi:hypothetical protein